MSLIDQTKDDLVAAVAKLPIEAIVALVKLVRGALASNNPTEYIARRAEADLAHAATKAAAEQALKARAGKA